MSDLENTEGFQQPSLNEDPTTAPGYVDNDLVVRDAPLAVVNSGKTDELSVALAESRKPVPTSLVEAEKPVGKFALDYSLKGEAIHETHATIKHALARIAALARLGIVPATSTNV